MNRYDHMTPNLDGALISGYPRSQVFIPESDVLFLRNMVWKAAILRQMFHSEMFDGEDAVRTSGDMRRRCRMKILGMCT